VLVTAVLTALTLLSVGLLLWQFLAARRFPLHTRRTDLSFTPAITLLKPLKGADGHTADCLRSWLTQQYPAPIQVLFGVADENDPVCKIVRALLAEFPQHDAELFIAPKRLGPNAKVSTLAQLWPRAKHEVVCVSDADVFAPSDFLAQSVATLRDRGVGLVNCFYELSCPATLAMRWEALAVNADFWSQVLQANTIKRQDFALGAVMMARRETLARIGGFEPLLDYLADDYQFGRRIAASGARVELSPFVVECRDTPMRFAAVWKHQVRWARTIRASQPLAYFFSILSNVTLWALLLMAFGTARQIALFGMTDRGAVYLAPWRDAVSANSALVIEAGYGASLLLGLAAVGLRIFLGTSLAVRLTRRREYFDWCWLVPIKDLLQAGVWAAAFLGNTVTWGGRKFRITRGGRLSPVVDRSSTHRAVLRADASQSPR
jgi:ceramide glucosyltransferase